MNKILILGASGFLGKALVKHFTLKGFRVGALSRNCELEMYHGVTCYNIDILNYKELELVVSKYDTVINCTGQITNPVHDCMLLNTKGIQNIINAVSKHNSYLIHLSTVGVYGESNLIVTEKSVLNPQSVYGSMKYFSEFQIQNALSKYSILRVCNLYGKTQTKGILGYILRSHINKTKELYFDNDGSLKRYYLQIDQFSTIIELIMLKKLQGIYNIIGKDFLTIKELVTICESKLNCYFDISYEKSKPKENIYQIDDTKLRSNINYENSYSLEKNLEELMK